MVIQILKIQAALSGLCLFQVYNIIFTLDLQKMMHLKQ